MGRLENAVCRGHDPETCQCVVCKDGRGEPRLESMKRRAKKPSAKRGYLWLTHEDDRRIHETANLLGVSCSELVRRAITNLLDSVDAEFDNALEA